MTPYRLVKAVLSSSTRTCLGTNRHVTSRGGFDFGDGTGNNGEILEGSSAQANHNDVVADITAGSIESDPDPHLPRTCQHGLLGLGIAPSVWWAATGVVVSISLNAWPSQMAETEATFRGGFLSLWEAKEDIPNGGN